MPIKVRVCVSILMDTDRNTKAVDAVLDRLMHGTDKIGDAEKDTIKVEWTERVMVAEGQVIGDLGKELP